MIKKEVENDHLKLLSSPGLTSFFDPNAPQIKMTDHNAKDMDGAIINSSSGSLSAEATQVNFVASCSQAKPPDSI